MRALPNEEDFSIKIVHLPTGQKVNFIGWVTSFSDTFNSTWNDVSVYGRMDPLPTFQNTQRKLSIGFNVTAGSAEEAYINDKKMNRLIQFLYPVYDRGEGPSGASSRDQSIVAAAPLLKVSYANLAQNNVDQTGLVAYLEGVDYTPNLEAGQFFAGALNTSGSNSTVPGSTYQGNSQPANQMFYQELSVSLSFTILHSHLTGWVKGEGNSFYFGGDPETDANAKFLHNFPHGGTNDFLDSGLDPVPVATPASVVDPDPTNEGNNAEIMAEKAEQTTAGPYAGIGGGGDSVIG